jgi:hypothetical protein
VVDDPIVEFAVSAEGSYQRTKEEATKILDEIRKNPEQARKKTNKKVNKILNEHS